MTPPMMTIAIDRVVSEPGPRARAEGMAAATQAREVMRMGLNLRGQASRRAG